MYQRITALLIAVVFAWTWTSTAESANDRVWLVDLEGAVGPARVDLVIRTIEDANEMDREAVIIRMNTPGGLDKSMRDLVDAILASDVPVITYVAPNGARAASAGTFITYASHIAAMAPATNIGSSTPVMMGGQPPPNRSAGQDGDEPAPAPADAMTRKVVNDAVAYLQGIAELRGRNIEWAEETVREGANLRASAALEINVIDIVAEDIAELLAAVDGRTVDVASGTHTFTTASATVHVIEPDWRHNLLATITDPSIAYGLLIIGLYALLFEFYNPGLIVPALVGAIFILLGAYGLQLLPVNYAGLALVVLGIALMIAEIMSPSVGVLGVGGLVAFVLGSLLMFDSDMPGYTLPLGVIAAFTVSTALTVFLVVGMAVRARKQRVVTGVEAMVGASAVVTTTFTLVEEHYEGDVFAFAEHWHARCDKPLEQGAEVRVDAVDGLILDVREET